MPGSRTYITGSQAAHPVPQGTPGKLPVLLVVTTIADTLTAFLQRQLLEVKRAGFDVHTASSPPSEKLLREISPDLNFHAVEMKRGYGVFQDLRSLWALVRLMRSLKPDIVHAHTPKAGLLAITAAWLARVPVRIRTLNGLVFTSCTGPQRKFLAAVERFTCSLSTEVFCVSPSLSRIARAARLCAPDKLHVFGDGGSHGVDLDRFDPERFHADDRRQTRAECGIPADATVLTFVGRLARDKGIFELQEAWMSLREEFPDLRLLVCGSPDRRDPVSQRILGSLANDPRVTVSGGFVSEMPRIYSITDVCVLPTYREGLSNVALECAAMRVPIVTTRVPGCVDVVRHGADGLLVPRRNAGALKKALEFLIRNPDIRSRFAMHAREEVALRFDESHVTRLLLAAYEILSKPEATLRVRGGRVSGPDCSRSDC